MKDVEGKVAFITGGASGIGLGIAQAFLGAGMKVVIADLRQDHIDEVMPDLQKLGEVHAIRLDITDRKALADAARETEQVFNKVHVLVNNAGVNIVRPIQEATFEDFDWLVNVNILGTVNGVLTFLPYIKAHGEGGHIVNTSSVAGIITGPGTSIYSATKFAIRGMSEALRYDLAPDRIGVSVLCPGTVSTKLYESEDNRQARFMGEVTDAVKTSRAFTGDLFRRVLPMGKQPLEVGERTLKGIRENAMHIMTHVEVETDIREAYDEMLAALPDEAPDPAVMAHEASRREGKYKLLKMIKEL